MQKITPNLWFDSQAEEAAKFYTSIFKNAKIGNIARYGEAGQEVHGQKPGTVMTVEFELEGFQFVGLNGGPLFTFNPSVSFFVNCKTREEADDMWAKLSEGGKVLMPLDTYPFSPRYGWTNDKFGVSWQINLSPNAPNIMPSLLFVGENCGKAEEAISFYAEVFKNAKVGDIARYPAGSEPDKEGTVMYGEVTLEGQLFALMDSAREHGYQFNEAVSLIINCDTQEEVDYYWQKLSAVPEAEQCGWLKDKYGVAWQVTPVVLNKLVADQTSEGGKRAMQAMLQMKKLDIKKLQAAYDGKQ